MTHKSIAELKGDSQVLQHLKKATTFLRGHYWKEDEVSLKDIGFLLKYVPTKHSKEYVKQDLYDRCTRIQGIEWRDAPAFQLIHAQPKVTQTGKKTVLKTHAFSIQVLSHDASTMNKFLQKIFASDHLYMPYTMKKQFPKAVATAILQ